MNTKHPKFSGFLDNMTKSIVSQFNINNYFNLTTDKKITLQYTIFALIKSSHPINDKINQHDLNELFKFLCKKNEISENYELASIFKDISNNINDFSNTKKINVDKNKIINK